MKLLNLNGLYINIDRIDYVSEDTSDLNRTLVYCGGAGNRVSIAMPIEKVIEKIESALFIGISIA